MTAKTIKEAPLPLHSIIFLSLIILTIILTLPPMTSLDEVATSETFCATVYKDPESLPSSVLGLIRLSVGTMMMLLTVYFIVYENWEETTFYLPGSKLIPTTLHHYGLRSQGFYTQWSWTALSLSFILTGVIPLLPSSYHHPYLLRLSLIMYIIANPGAMLVSIIVTYILWPEFLKKRGSEGTGRYKHWPVLVMHNINAFLAWSEIIFLGKIPILGKHIMFSPVMGLIYIFFSSFMSKRWKGKQSKEKEEDDVGPQFVYFFLDTTLPGYQTSYCLLGLLSVLLFFYGMLSLLQQYLFHNGNLQYLFGEGNMLVVGRMLIFGALNYMVCRIKD